MQRFNFVEVDAGHFWLNEEERAVTKHDSHTRSLKTVNKMKQELVASFVSMSIVVRGTKDEVTQIEKAKNLDVVVIIERTNEGWSRFPKGLLQVLWERGFIEQTKLKSHAKRH